MNSCVCLKIVPDPEQVSFDTERGTLRRGGAALCVNEADLVALEAALLLQKRYGGSVHGVCMGPAASEPALKTAFFLGADELFLLSSPRFAGADVAATAYALSRFFSARSPYDLILCGKSSSDGNTGQVGAYLAALLGIPHLHNVARIGGADGAALEAWQRLDGLEQQALAELPALLVIEPDFAQPHTPSLSQTLRARGKSVRLLGEGDLPGLDAGRCGAKGSKTRVKKVFAPPKKSGAEMIPLRDIGRLLPLLTEVEE